jgi:hypothetical protein
MGGQGGRPVMTNKPAAADLAKALAAMEATGRGPSRAYRCQDRAGRS